MIDTNALHDMSVDQLDKEVIGLSKQLFHYRMQNAEGYLTKNHFLKATKRDIARVKTVLTAKRKELSQATKTVSDGTSE